MPRYRMERQETGEQYTTIEVDAENEEEARDMIFDDEGVVVCSWFKQRDAEEISFVEVKDG